MIDRNEFDDLFKSFGKEIVVEIIDIFISEYDDRFKHLRENVAAMDFKNLEFNSHSLKGVIAHFKDPVTTEQSRRLNAMAKEKVEAGLEKALQDLEKSSALLLEELKTIKKQLT